MVMVEGELTEPKPYQSKGDGEWRASLDVTAHAVKFLSAKGDAGQASEGESGGDDETEVPF